jgi:hypothetical protein
LVFEEIGEIPAWPQLSSYDEQMMVQFNEGLPGLDSKNDRILFAVLDPGFEQELLAFYEEYLPASNGEFSLDESRFRFGEDTGRTFFAFLERLKRQELMAAAVKGQITGPFTLLATLKDENGQLALYDPRLRDVVVKYSLTSQLWLASDHPPSSAFLRKTSLQCSLKWPATFTEPAVLQGLMFVRTPIGPCFSAVLWM